MTEIWILQNSTIADIKLSILKVKEIININHEYRQQLRSRSWNEIDTRYFGNLTIIGIEQN